MPPAFLPVIAVAILVLQQRFFAWWLSRLAQGPVEWVWRCLTYPAGSSTSTAAGLARSAGRP